jgi:hypothetical protein
VSTGQTVINAMMRLLRRSLSVLCALTVAMVTTFHVCNAANGRIVEIVALSAEGDGGCPPSLEAIEKCHTCALASLPVILAAEQVVELVHVIPAGTTLQVTPFSQPTIGPPPRT